MIPDRNAYREPMEAIALCTRCTKRQCPGDCEERRRTAKAALEGRSLGRLYEMDGEWNTLTGWAVKYGIRPNTLSGRIHRQGMTLRAALEKPVEKQTLYRIGGREDTAKGWAAYYGLSPSTLHRHLKDGMEIEEAIRQARRARERRRRAKEKAYESEREP